MGSAITHQIIKENNSDIVNVSFSNQDEIIFQKLINLSHGAFGDVSIYVCSNTNINLNDNNNYLLNNFGFKKYTKKNPLFNEEKDLLKKSDDEIDIFLRKRKEKEPNIESISSCNKDAKIIKNEEPIGKDNENEFFIKEKINTQLKFDELINDKIYFNNMVKNKHFNKFKVIIKTFFDVNLFNRLFVMLEYITKNDIKREKLKNIVGGFYCYGSNCLILPYIDGVPLSKLDYDAITDKLMCELNQNIMLAYQPYRDNFLLHGDIKPDNILITDNLRIYFCDYDNIIIQLFNGNNNCEFCNRAFYNDFCTNIHQDLLALEKLYNYIKESYIYTKNKYVFLKQNITTINVVSSSYGKKFK